jgi:hypothetical protein
VTPGNLELLQIVVSWTVTLPAVVAILARDERGLSCEALARAWPPPSRDAAIFTLWNLGIEHYCLFIHFVRTRRSVDGFALGLRALIVLGLLDDTAQIAVAAAVDWLGL